MEWPDGMPGAENVHAAEALLAEVVTLAEVHCDADIGAFREVLSERRPAIDPAAPDLLPGRLLRRRPPGCADRPWWCGTGG
jgi:hypothetical protein